MKESWAELSFLIFFVARSNHRKCSVKKGERTPILKNICERIVLYGLSWRISLKFEILVSEKMSTITKSPASLLIREIFLIRVSIFQENVVKIKRRLFKGFSFSFPFNKCTVIRVDPGI